MEGFKLTRVYSDREGNSHFETIEVPLHDIGDLGRLSKGEATGEIIFREVEPTYDLDFHTAPQRQYIVLLDVGVEIETSLGDKRSFQAGEVLLMEDTMGKGHRTRNLQALKRRSIFITLP